VIAIVHEEFRGYVVTGGPKGFHSGWKDRLKFEIAGIDLAGANGLTVAEHRDAEEATISLDLSDPPLPRMKSLVCQNVPDVHRLP